MNHWGQYVALLRKNFLIKRRSFGTLLEILLPFIVFCSLVIVKEKVELEQRQGNLHNHQQSYFSQSVRFYTLQEYLTINNVTLGFVPPEETAPFREFLLDNGFSSNRMIVFDDRNQMDNYIQGPEYGFRDYKLHSVLDAINLEGPEYKFALHMNGTRPTSFMYNVPSTYSAKLNLHDNTYHSEWMLYDYSGFMTFQSLVDQWIFQKEDVIHYDNWTPWQQDITFPTIHQPFATPYYIIDKFVLIVRESLGFTLTLIFVWSITRVVTSFVEERENLSLFHQQLMGLTTRAHLAAWTTTYAVIFAIISALLTFAGAFGVYSHSFPLFIWLFYFLFGMCIFSMGFVLSSFFSDAKTASIWASIIFVLTFFISFLVQSEDSSAFAKTMVCLVPTACLAVGGRLMSQLEGNNVGVTWGTISTQVDQFSFIQACVMLLIDVFLWFFIGFYLNSIIPKDYGIAKPWYFLFQKEFWCCFSSSSSSSSSIRTKRTQTNALNGSIQDQSLDEAVVDSTQADSSYYEEENEIDWTQYNEPTTVIESSATHGESAIKLHHLRKTYSLPQVGFKKFLCCFRNKHEKDFVAVKDMTLNLQKNRIHVLIGVNGAGKSTTFSMASGMIAPTSGDITVLGKNISAPNGLQHVYSNQGICFQRDVLYPDLTVWEHLQLYAALKQPKIQRNTEEVRQYLLDLLDKVGLGPLGDNKTHAWPGNLSGGQKRKLSLILALLNDSPLIYLDECSTGIDVRSLRSIWDVILAETDRTFIITTHNMLEAQKLSDTIHMIAAGKLLCSGSALFLQNYYKGEYTLTINKDLTKISLAQDRLPQAIIPSPSQHRSDSTTKVLLSSNLIGLPSSPPPSLTTQSGLAIYNHLSSRYSFVTLAGDNAGEIKLKLPASEIDHFPSLLDNVEMNKEELIISSFGVSMTNLTDIFLLLNQGQGRDDDPDMNPHMHETALSASSSSPSSPNHNNNANNNNTNANNSNNSNTASNRPQLTSTGEYQPPTLHTHTHTTTSSHQNLDDLHPNSSFNSSEDGENSVELSTPNFSDSRDQFLFTSPSAKSVSPNQLDTLPNTTLLSPQIQQQQQHQHHNQAAQEPIYTDLELEAQWSSIALESYKSLSQFQVWWKHFGALYLKRVNIAKRDLRGVLWQIIYPTLVLLAGLSLLTWGIPRHFKPLTLNPELYPEGTQFVLAGGGDNQVAKAFYDTMENVVAPRYNGHLQVVRKPELTSLIDFQWYQYESYHDRPLHEPLFGGMLINEMSNLPYDPLSTNTSLMYSSLHFNTTAKDSLPVYKNVVSNTLLAMKNPKASITVINSPMPVTNRERLFQTSSLSLIISIAFSFIPASYVWFVVKERSDHIKHLQQVNGMSNSSYWISTYVFDLTTFIVPFCLYMGLLFFFNVDVLTGSPEMIFVTVLLAWLYILASCPFSYTLSFAFDNHIMAQNLTLLLNFLASVVLLILSIALSMIEDTKDVAKILRYFYRLLPSYCIGDALAMIMLRDNLMPGESIWSRDILGMNVLFLCIDIVLYSILVLVLEYLSSNNILEYLQGGCRSMAALDDPDELLLDPFEDQLVKEERERIEKGEHDGDAVVVKGLRKLYQSSQGPFAAIGHQFFHVKEGEIFGLCGPNGGGKSSTMNIITARLRPTKGDAFILGASAINQSQTVRHLLGYVPQFDALFPLLTGREHLLLFARLKCVPESHIHDYVNYIIKRLGIQHLADKPSASYSGGNKRKLQLGLALFGKIICLDEISSGVDQASQRQLWSLISTSLTGRAVILTSHHLDEVENLCSNIGIMCSGRFRALGSANQLKERFGSHFQIDISIPDSNLTQTASQWMMDTFTLDKEQQIALGDKHPNSITFFSPTGKRRKLRTIELVETHKTTIVFKVLKGAFSLATLFSILQTASKEIITGYTINQTSLDQVFVDLVREDDERRSQGQLRL